MDTGCLGGVPHPTEEELAAMQKDQYILHARGGKLTKVPAEKSQLPHDPKGHIQSETTAAHTIRDYCYGGRRGCLRQPGEYYVQVH